MPKDPITPESSVPPGAVPVEVIVLDPFHPDTRALDRAGSVLRGGGLVAFPTETVYGLGAAVTDEGAVEAVFRCKGRPSTDPLIVHVMDLAGAAEVVADIPDRAHLLADAFWPGPLTMVLPRGPLVPPAVTADLPAVGVRVPAHPVAQGLLRSAGVPVAAPSANRFGRISPTAASDVLEELGAHLQPGRDLVLDGGSCPLGIESTVVDLTGERPRILRHGGVTLEDLQDVVGDVDQAERDVRPEDEAAAGPGQFLRHYAPRTPLCLVEGEADLVSGLIAGLARRSVRAGLVDLPADPDRAARSLYAALRSADRSDHHVLLVRTMAGTGLGRAVNDRLFRAAHGRVVASADDAAVDRIARAARA